MLPNARITLSSKSLLAAPICATRRLAGRHLTSMPPCAPQCSKHNGDNGDKATAAPGGKWQSHIAAIEEDLTAQQTALAGSRAKLAADQKAFEEMKAAMSSMTVSDADIVYLNVGGEKFCCRRSTLWAVKGSVLEQMFDQPWFEQLVADRNDDTFLDWNPAFFKLVLNHLRTAFNSGEAGVEPFPLEDVPVNELARFKAFVKFLKLDSAFFPCIRSIRSDTFDPASATANCLLDKDGKVVTAALTCSNNAGSERVCGSTVVKAGTTAVWTVQLKTKNVSGYSMRLGVVGVSCVGDLRSMQLTQTGTYMFSAAESRMYINGVSYGWSHSISLPPKAGEIITLALNTNTLELTLCWQGRSCMMKLQPSTKGWRLCLMPMGPGLAVQMD